MNRYQKAFGQLIVYACILFMTACSCPDGHQGSDCDECSAGYHKEDGVCVGDFHCQKNTCHYRGECIDRKGFPTCRCDIGYAGHYCETCAQGYIDIDLTSQVECWLTDACSQHSCLQLTAADAKAEDLFGKSVSISDGIAIVGAPQVNSIEGDPLYRSGAAYIFQIQSDKQSWEEKVRLSAIDAEANDNFGQSVYIFGEWAVVGAPEKSLPVNVISSAGAAYVFKLENGTWLEKQMLTASDKQSNDKFGSSVSISDGLIIVGAPGKKGGEHPYNSTGAAYIFKYDDILGSWIEMAILEASDAQAMDHFGSSVSISGEVAIVGAYGESGASDDPDHASGAAYLFHLDNEIWVQKQKLSNTDAYEYENFGKSVAVSGEVAVIGAPRKKVTNEETGYYFYPGAAHIYQLVEGSWVEKEMLAASDSQHRDRFGYSVMISEDRIIIGAPNNDGKSTTPIEDSGSAYIYEFENGQWIEKEKLTDPEPHRNDRFGASVSIGRDKAIVGADQERFVNREGGPVFDAGAAYIF